MTFTHIMHVADRLCHCLRGVSRRDEWRNYRILIVKTWRFVTESKLSQFECINCTGAHIAHPEYSSAECTPSICMYTFNTESVSHSDIA